MQCSDLERYLEAHVDGRLGRAGSSILRRHLLGCPTCRGRVARLREFERDVRSRLQSTEHAMSLWQGLDREPALSLLAPRTEQEARPKRSTEIRARLPRPVVPVETGGTLRRTWSLRLAGLALLGLAAAGVVDTVRGVSGLDASTPEPDLLLKVAETTLGVQPRGAGMTTGTPEEMRGWLEAQLGHPLPSLAAPSGYALTEGGVADVRGVPAALLHYNGIAKDAARSVLVLLEPLAAGSAAAAPANAATVSGVRQVSWSADDFHYTAFAADGQGDLAQFAK